MVMSTADHPEHDDSLRYIGEDGVSYPMGLMTYAAASYSAQCRCS